MGETVAERRDRNRRLAAMESTAKALGRIADALAPTSKETAVDENLVRPAIQFKNQEKFEDRFRFFDSEDERDEAWVLLASRQGPEVLDNMAKVTVVCRVETEYE